MRKKKKSGQAGFTLVELIVVIAILGILAGIAVPVYSGYVDKAGEASDQALLAAVNTAFAAACAERNVDPKSIAAIAMMSDDFRIVGLKPTALSEPFLFYYGDNVNRPFKVFKSLTYNRDEGIFEPSYERMQYSWKDSYLPISQEDANLLKDSYLINEEGSGDLLAKVRSVIGQVNGLAGKEKLTATYKTDEFNDFFKEATGVDVSTCFNASATASEKSAFEAAWSASGLGEDKDQILLNAMVLYAARNVESIEKGTDFYDAVTSEDSASQAPAAMTYMLALRNLMTGNAVEGSDIVKSSIVYTMKELGKNNFQREYLALAADLREKMANNDLSSEEAQKIFAERYGDSAILASANITSAQQYYDANLRTADADAFIAAMNMINSNMDSKENVVTLLNSGFDGDLVNAINEAMGIGGN